MKKRSTSRNIVALLGMGLILFGVVWTCLKTSRPGELNAAPGPIRSAQRNPAPPAQPIAPLADDEEITFPTLESEPESAPPAQELPFGADPANVMPAKPLEEPSFDDAPAFDPQPQPIAPSAAPGTPVLPPSAKPGSIELEGPQTAQLVIVKEIPEEISFGAESFYRIHIKNAGGSIARGVVVRDAVPEGTRFINSQPTASLSGAEMTWPPFDMKPNEERVFECRFVPETEGVIGSTATVSFAAEASGKTTCTRPQLRLLVSAPARATLGDVVKFDISITNTGTGTAKGVTLLENVPDGLRHPSGRMLNNVIGDIKPGETKQLALSLHTAAPGVISNVMSVSTESGLSEETTTELTVDAPELSLEISGSKNRYLQREAVYRLKVWNPGSAPAKGVKLTAELPKEMEFVRTNNEGVYQESTHSVHWELVELPEKTAPGEIELVLKPQMIGAGKLVFRGEDSQQLSASTEQEVVIDGMTALGYKIEPASDSVETGGEAVFNIVLSNKGTKEATDVQMQIGLAPGMEVVNMEGPTRYTQQGNALVFAPISKIGAREETTYKLTVKCSVQGDQRLSVQVGADGIQPLMKEESILVY
ncbi:MAG: DUF11 domain-containing protein [Thermoguttaceae bacterium]|nr:DUF11 domain-containing protein [Thermoguttaceae bacterium]